MTVTHRQEPAFRLAQIARIISASLPVRGWVQAHPVQRHTKITRFEFEARYGSMVQGCRSTASYAVPSECVSQVQQC